MPTRWFVTALTNFFANYCWNFSTSNPDNILFVNSTFQTLLLIANAETKADEDVLSSIHTRTDLEATCVQDESPDQVKSPPKANRIRMNVKRIGRKFYFPITYSASRSNIFLSKPVGQSSFFSVRPDAEGMQMTATCLAHVSSLGVRSFAYY